MTQKNKVEKALEVIASAELVPGTIILMERFEEVLGIGHKDPNFTWLISGFRRALFERGVYLSGEGLELTGGYTILPYSENFYMAKLAMERNMRQMEGMQTLLVNTPVDGLTALQKSRHENTLRTLSLRLGAMRKVQENNRKTGAARKALLEDRTDES